MPEIDRVGDAKRLIVVLAASFLMALNIKTFVRTGGLYPGGATGLSILIQRLFNNYMNLSVPYTVINLIVNAIPVYIGFRYIGKKFTLYSLVMIVVSSFLTDLLPSYALTYDTLLISIFGGMINGLAISMCLAVGATSGGTDFISIYLSQKTGMDSFNVILIFNCGILAVAGLNFGWDKALYSIIFQYASTQVLHLLYQNYQQVTLFIVTEKPFDVAREIYRLSMHGATIIDAEGSYERSDKKIVYSVIAAADLRKVIKGVRRVDGGAFINSVRTKELKGKFYQKPEN